MLYVSIFLLNVLDLILTHIGVNIMGFYELNPIFRPLISSWVIVPLKLGGAFLVAYGLYYVQKKVPGWKLARGVTWGVVILYSLVVINNAIALILG